MSFAFSGVAHGSFDDSHVGRLIDVARELTLHEDEQLALQTVAEQAVVTVPGCDHAAVSIRRAKGVVETPAYTAELVKAVDELQYSLDEGPCLDVIRSAELLLVDDTATDDRWPRWSPKANELGIRSVLSVRVATGERVIGGLNLYSHEVASYDELSVRVAHQYAAQAALAMAVVARIDGLRAALETRHTIGLAQGILMQQDDLDTDGAFSALVRRSQDSNVKLRDVARRVVVERENRSRGPGVTDRGGRR